MRCTEPSVKKRLAAHLGSILSTVLAVAGCSTPSPTSGPAVAARPAPAPAPTQPQASVTRSAAPTVAMPAPRRARNWDDYRVQAAQRMVAASRSVSYDGPVPEPLLAIPVLEIELNGDGSVRRVTVLRKPTQALDTVQLAIDAVHRAAPFGDVTHLPRPWKFAEVFLFNDDRRFKPRSLDL